MFCWYNDISFRWKLTLPLTLLVIIFVGVSVYAVRATTAGASERLTELASSLRELVVRFKV